MNKITPVIYLLASFILIFISSCKKEEGSEVISFLTDTLFFDYGTDSGTVILKSFGNKQSSWTISSSAPYLSINPSSGTLGPGESVTLQFVLDRSTFTSYGNYYSTLDVTYSGGSRIARLVTRVRDFQESKTYLNKDVVDAEFDQNADKIIFVSANPMSLNVIQNPQNPIISTLALNYIPFCVSISPSGSEAVVGHDGKVTLIDLTNLHIIQTYNVTCKSFDIVHGGNGWVYVFPADQQWTKIRCINLSTGAESLSTGNSIYGNTKAKLYPPGNYIYGANNGLSPSDIEKYDISSGTAERLYDSPYHGDYDFSGDFWFLNGSYNLISRAGTSLSTSVLQSQDLLYFGALVMPSLSGPVPRLTGMFQAVSSNKLLCIFSSGYNPSSYIADSAMYVYDATSLAITSRIAFEPFLSTISSLPDPLVPALGQFIFGSATGTKAYAITRAQSGVGATTDFTLQVIDY